MFKTRLISGIVLIAVLLAVLLAGNVVTLASLAALSAIGIFEFYKATGLIKDLKQGGAKLNLLPAVGIAGGFLLYGALYLRRMELTYAFVCLVVLALLAVYVLTYPRYDASDVIKAVTGFVYVAVLLSTIFLIRDMDGGKKTVWLVFLAAWGSDTFAYCTGMLIGKHKMTPVLSPKKTIEGAVGGVVGAVLLGVLYALIMKEPPIKYGVICFAGSLISMIGDLAASAIKRKYEIKDYGNLIPGHGGVLDRFDSIILTAPLVYFVILVIS